MWWYEEDIRDSYLSLYNMLKEVRVPTPTQHLSYLQVVIQVPQLIHHLLWRFSSYATDNYIDMLQQYYLNQTAINECALIPTEHISTYKSGDCETSHIKKIRISIPDVNYNHTQTFTAICQKLF